MGAVTLVTVAAVALWRAPHWSRALVATVVLMDPAVGMIAVGALAVRARLTGAVQITPDEEAALLRDLAAELEGGASVRAGLMRTFRSSGARLNRAIRLGYPGSVVAAELEGLLPLNGRRAAIAISLGATSGASLRTAVGLLAARATHRGRLLRERRAATAQARATAWLLSSLPAAVVAFTVASGRLADSAALPVVAVGLALQGAGLGIVVAMLRRGE